MVLLFLGPKGCGKDVQARRLEDNYGFINISSGALLRDEIINKTDLGKKIAKIYKSGKYVEDEILLKTLYKHQHLLKSKNIILNGVIRRISQIDPIEKLLEKYEKKVDYLIHFQILEKTVLERVANRWICPFDSKVYHTTYDPPKVPGICDLDGVKLIQREDDKPSAVKLRLKEDNKNKKPVIDYYNSLNKTINIDASKSIANVSDQIIKSLDLKSK